MAQLLGRPFGNFIFAQQGANLGICFGGFEGPTQASLRACVGTCVYVHTLHVRILAVMHVCPTHA